MSDDVKQDIPAEVVEQAVAEALADMGLTTRTEFDAEQRAVALLKQDRDTLKAALAKAKLPIPALVSE